MSRHLETGPDRLSTFSQRPKLPSYTVWKQFKAHREQQGRLGKCVGCLLPVSWFKANPIILSARVKMWEEETVVVGGVEVKDLKSKVVPVMLKGPGCPDCQLRFAKAQSEEAKRYETATASHFSALRDPARGRYMKGLKSPNQRQAGLDVLDEVMEFAEKGVSE